MKCASGLAETIRDFLDGCQLNQIDGADATFRIRYFRNKLYHNDRLISADRVDKNRWLIFFNKKHSTKKQGGMLYHYAVKRVRQKLHVNGVRRCAENHQSVGKIWKILTVTHTINFNMLT